MECLDWRSFALLAAAVFVVFADQNLLAPNLTQIARDFGFSDAERDARLGGDISFAFFLLGLPACLVIGALTDVVQRKRLLVWTIVLGQGPCLLTLFVSTYWELFVLRTLTGIAVGGALPLVFSIAGDLFPPNSRSYASSMVGLCMHLGSGFGQGVAGFLGPDYGWRVPFAVVAVPGLIVAWGTARFMVEPQRGGVEGGAATVAAAAASGSWSLGALVQGALRKSGSVLRRPTNVLGFLQGIPGCVPWSFINVFMNDYLAVDKGLGVKLATALMMAFGLGAVAGVVVGGVVGQMLYNAKPWYMTTAMGSFAIAGIFPLLYLTNADDYDAGDRGNLVGKFAVAVFGGVLVTMTGTNVRAMIVNVNAPYERGTAFATFNLTDDLGKGLGPLLSSFLIARMGRNRAFSLALWFWLPCGLLCIACGLTMEKDEEAMRKEVEELAASRGEDRVGEGGEYDSLLAREDVDKTG